MVPSIGMFPIDPVGIIESQFETVLVAGSRQFLHNVPFGVGELSHIVIAHLAVPQRKTIMVLGREGDIFHSGFFCQQYPLFWINAVPVEAVQQSEGIRPGQSGSGNRSIRRNHCRFSVFPLSRFLPHHCIHPSG